MMRTLFPKKTGPLSKLRLLSEPTRFVLSPLTLIQLLKFLSVLFFILFSLDAQKENACQACGESDNLVSCNTCTYAYHAKCLIPPLKDASVENWRCPECVRY